MKAIIMAAGRATRMLPLTKNIPKCLLKIKEKTILQHQINVLKSCGVKDIVIIIGHGAKEFEELYEKDLKYVFNPFYKVSGMLMSLWVAKAELDDDILLIYSDVLFNEKIIKKLLDCEGDISLAVDKGSVDWEAEKVKIKNGVIVNISKTDIDIGGADGEFIGLIKFKKNLNKVVVEELETLARSNINAYLIDLIKNIITGGAKVLPCDITGELWTDIDFPEDLEKIEELNFV